MTEEQYKKYKEKKKELEHLKDFLSNCGNKYYEIGFCSASFNFIIRRKKRKFGLHRNLHWGGVEKNSFFDISDELQNDIIKLVENYAEKLEKELEEI